MRNISQRFDMKKRKNLETRALILIPIISLGVVGTSLAYRQVRLNQERIEEIKFCRTQADMEQFKGCLWRVVILLFWIERYNKF